MFVKSSLISVIWNWSGKDVECPVAGDVVRKLTSDEFVVSSKSSAFCDIVVAVCCQFRIV